MENLERDVIDICDDDGPTKSPEYKTCIRLVLGGTITSVNIKKVAELKQLWDDIKDAPLPAITKWTDDDEIMLQRIKNSDVDDLLNTVMFK